eukprot:scaffold1277_cov329-Prasinococcus_capsulatus_cf.AAC.9
MMIIDNDRSSICGPGGGAPAARVGQPLARPPRARPGSADAMRCGAGRRPACPERALKRPARAAAAAQASERAGACAARRPGAAGATFERTRATMAAEEPGEYTLYYFDIAGKGAALAPPTTTTTTTTLAWARDLNLIAAATGAGRQGSASGWRCTTGGCPSATCACRASSSTASARRGSCPSASCPACRCPPLRTTTTTTAVRRRRRRGGWWCSRRPSCGWWASARGSTRCRTTCSPPRWTRSWTTTRCARPNRPRRRRCGCLAWLAEARGPTGRPAAHAAARALPAGHLPRRARAQVPRALRLPRGGLRRGGGGEDAARLGAAAPPCQPHQGALAGRGGTRARATGSVAALPRVADRGVAHRIASHRLAWRRAQVLEEGGSGWLAGTAEPTIADFFLIPPLQQLLEEGNGVERFKALGAQFPALRALCDRFHALPAIAEYYDARAADQAAAAADAGAK